MVKMPILALAALALAAAPVAADPGCAVLDAAPEDAPLAAAACETARERFAELFGAPVPPVKVYVWQQHAYRAGTDVDGAVMYWPSGRSMTARWGSSDAAERHIAGQWRDVLPHEIVHALLAYRYFPDGYARGGYGTPFPDWLDEGVAIWAESPDHRGLRIEQARALPDARRDLRAILSTPHPAAVNRSLLAIRDGAAIPDDEALWSFYPQSIAVVAFVHEAGGTEAFRELARRLLADPEDVEAIAGLPGLPSEMDDVVAAWHAWLDAGGAEAARTTDG